MVLKHLHNLKLQAAVLLLVTLGVIALVEVTGLVSPRKTGTAVSVGRQDLPDFSAIPTAEARKANFFGYLRPIVRAENREVLRTRERLRELVGELRGGDDLSPGQWTWMRDLARRYRVDLAQNNRLEVGEALLRKVDKIPSSLVLVQAAKESAWGTSRFAREGNNLFGQWCFTPGCGMVPARRAEGKTHEVESFPTVRASVASYLRNLNSHPRYSELRDIRARLRREDEEITGLALAGGLQHYSEQGEKYVTEVRAMIRRNGLGGVDHGS